MKLDEKTLLSPKTLTYVPIISKILLHHMTNSQRVSISSRVHETSVGGLKWKRVLEPWNLLAKEIEIMKIWELCNYP